MSGRDVIQIEPRIRYCLRAARARASLPEMELVLRMRVRPDGSADCVHVELDPEHRELATCIRELVRTAKYVKDIEARDGAGRWTLGPEPRAPKSEPAESAGSNAGTGK